MDTTPTTNRTTSWTLGQGKSSYPSRKSSNKPDDALNFDQPKYLSGVGYVTEAPEPISPCVRWLAVNTAYGLLFAYVGVCLLCKPATNLTYGLFCCWPQPVAVEDNMGFVALVVVFSLVGVSLVAHVCPQNELGNLGDAAADSAAETAQGSTSHIWWYRCSPCDKSSNPQ